MVTSPLETTGSNGCKVIRPGTGTRETNSPHNYARLPLPPPPSPPSSLVDISIRFIGVIGHGTLSRWLATSCTRVHVVYIRVDDNRYTRHTFTLGVQFDHDLETIVPFFRYDLQRHRCVVHSPRCFKTGGRRDRKKVTNRYPNLVLTLT